MQNPPDVSRETLFDIKISKAKGQQSLKTSRPESPSTLYLPMQNLENISPNKSSGVNAPVI